MSLLEGLKRMAFLGIVMFSLLITACQKTPEKKAVTQKIDNLAEYSEEKPLNPGENMEVSLPRNWKTEIEKKGQRESDGKVLIKADIDLTDKKFIVGNLPIVEMENKVLSKEDLEHLVDFFSNGRKPVGRKIDVKEYQDMLARLEEKKELFTPTHYAEIQAGLNRCMNKIEEWNSSQSDAPVVVDFGTTTSVPNMFAVFMDMDSDSMNENLRYTCSYEGDMNEKVSAVKFDRDSAKTSNFAYVKGEVYSLENLEEDRIFWEQEVNEQDKANYEILKEKGYQLLEERFTDENEKVARKILDDLGVKGYDISNVFPEYIFDTTSGIAFLDPVGAYWENAQIGQCFVFTQTVNGLAARTEFNDKVEMGEKQYVPPFGVESISVDVCNGEIRGFKWNNISQQVQTVVENTKLLDFQMISANVEKRLEYYIATLGGAHDLTDTEFQFDIQDIELGYAYIPAYNKPENAWLVPAWFVKIQETVNSAGRERVHFPQYTTVNALDGSIIIADSHVLNTQTQ